MKKALKHVDNFLRMGCKVEVVELPDKKDPAEYISELELVENEEVMEEVLEEME